MSKKKKKKKKTALPVNQQATTRSGGITTYYRKGKECHCASKRPAGSTEERDRRRAKRSERQRLLTSVFAFVDRLVKILQRKLVGANSWVPFAKDTSMTAPNLCHKVNGTACDEHGVENFRALFSASAGFPCRFTPAFAVTGGPLLSNGVTTAYSTRQGTTIRSSWVTSTTVCPTHHVCFTFPR